MIILRIIHSVLFYIIMVVSYLIGTLIAMAVAPFTPSVPRTYQAAGHIWARFSALFSGIKVEVSGTENLPRGRAVVLAANHQSGFDILILFAHLPTLFRFAPKKELFRVPVYGQNMKKAGYFQIDRKAGLHAHSIVEKMVGALKAEESVLIFPEGTRSKTGELARFKRGSLLPALKAKVPVVPITISGSFDILPPGSWIIHPRPVRMSIGKPVYINSEAEYEKKIEEVRQAIAGML